MSDEPVIHTLKCWPEFYRPVIEGRKRFDVRRGSDRYYRVGDYVDFKEWDPATKAFTGAHAVRRITYVLHGPPMLPEDYWVLSIELESPNPQCLHGGVFRGETCGQCGQVVGMDRAGAAGLKMGAEAEVKQLKLQVDALKREVGIFRWMTASMCTWDQAEKDWDAADQKARDIYLEGAGVTQKPKSEKCPRCGVMPIHHSGMCDECYVKMVNDDVAKKRLCEVEIYHPGGECGRPIPCPEHPEKRTEPTPKCINCKIKESGSCLGGLCIDCWNGRAYS